MGGHLGFGWGGGGWGGGSGGGGGGGAIGYIKEMSCVILTLKGLLTVCSRGCNRVHYGVSCGVIINTALILH